MKPTRQQFRPTEPYYRPGQLIDDSLTSQQTPASKEVKFQSKIQSRDDSYEKSITTSKGRPKPQESFAEETIEDLLDEDEKYPGTGQYDDMRAEPPSKDDEPQKATVPVIKPKEVKPSEVLPVLKADQRRLSQEVTSPKNKHPLMLVKSDKDFRGNFSVLSDKSKPDMRETPANLEEQYKTLSVSQLSTNGSFGIYGKLLAPSTAGMTEAELLAENKLLRHFLRDLNDILNQQVGKLKIEEDFDARKVEFRNKSPEEQKKTIVREIANNEKILAYNKEEHRKAEIRLNAIKDPEYVLNIQYEIDDIQTKIEDIKRDNRKLLYNNGNIAKDLDKIENVKGVPTSIEETREKEIEIKRWSRKLEGMLLKNATAEQEKTYKLEKRKTLDNEIKKLEKASENNASEEAINKISRMKYLKVMAEDSLKSTQKRLRTKKINAEREVEQALALNAKEKEYIDELDEIIKEQTAVLKGMISSERTRHNRSTQEVLDNLRLSIEYDERRTKWGSSTYIDDEKLEAMKITPNRPLKTKSIERLGGRVRRDLFELQNDAKKSHQSFSKYRNAVKRELVGAKNSYWRETTNGERARVEENFSASPARKRDSDDVELSLKPIVQKRFFGSPSTNGMRGSPVFSKVNLRNVTGERGISLGKSIGIGKSSSVKQINVKGLDVDSPLEYKLSQKMRDFNSKEWDGVKGEETVESSMGDNTARKAQQKKRENTGDYNKGKGREEESKPFASMKDQKNVKRKSQLEENAAEEYTVSDKRKTSMEEIQDDKRLKKVEASKMGQNVKRLEQPDNSQNAKGSKDNLKQINETKPNDLKKRRKEVEADFEELDFDDQ